LITVISETIKSENNYFVYYYLITVNWERYKKLKIFISPNQFFIYFNDKSIGLYSSIDSILFKMFSSVINNSSPNNFC
jgi:hypothetical protein